MPFLSPSSPRPELNGKEGICHEAQVVGLKMFIDELNITMR